MSVAGLACLRVSHGAARIPDLMGKLPLQQARCLPHGLQATPEFLAPLLQFISQIGACASGRPPAQHVISAHGSSVSPASRSPSSILSIFFVLPPLSRWNST